MGVAFLLVTFLWPRKEKSLAQARRAGETPSRATPSCPAWRSHANTLLQGNEVTEPLTLALSRRGRGDQAETPSRAAPSCPARRSRAIEAWGGIHQAMPLPTPHPSPLPQGERGANRSR